MLTDNSLLDAALHYAEVDRTVWADWWVKQEKQRLRAAVDREFTRRSSARAGQSGSGITARAVVQEILADVGDSDGGGGERPLRPYPEGQSPEGKKIEVGVFVVRRGHNR